MALVREGPTIFRGLITFIQRAAATVEGDPESWKDTIQKKKTDDNRSHSEKKYLPRISYTVENSKPSTSTNQQNNNDNRSQQIDYTDFTWQYCHKLRDTFYKCVDFRALNPRQRRIVFAE